MRLAMFPLFLGVLLLAGCGDATPPPQAKAPPFVRTVAVAAAGDTAFGLSGTVRARVESPLAFQVGGRSARRAGEAGQHGAAGQVLS